VSDADLYQPGSYNPVPSYNDLGGRDPYLEDIYLEAERLEHYGFTGFIGPEPHGSNPLNSGSSGPAGRGRDEVYADLGVEQLRAVAQRRQAVAPGDVFRQPARHHPVGKPHPGRRHQWRPGRLLLGSTTHRLKCAEGPLHPRLHALGE
jgi:hypothetical protein